MRKDVTDEEYERVKKHIHDYDYIDILMWRNEMIMGGNINNRLYYLIDSELEIRDRKRTEMSGKSK